jgi:SAM-dependent methyltransferase
VTIHSDQMTWSLRAAGLKAGRRVEWAMQPRLSMDITVGARGFSTAGSANIQGDLWGRNARSWAELQEPFYQPLWEAMLDAGGVGQGARLLDAGCGSGGAAYLAGRRGALVAGIDAADALIAIARYRWPEGDFHTGDLQALPFASGSFDCVIAVNSLQYAANWGAAARELRRVCSARGLVVVGTHGSPAECDERIILRVLRELITAPPKGGGPFSLSGSGVLERLLEQAGMRVRRSQNVSCPFTYPDLDTFWRAQLSIGPVHQASTLVNESLLKAAVLRAIEPYRTPWGGVRLDNRFRFVVARP